MMLLRTTAVTAALCLYLILAAGVAQAQDGTCTTISYDADVAAITWGYYCAGDYNQDGIVNISDLTRLGQNWEADVFKAAIDKNMDDFNQDGVVNFADLGVIGQNWPESLEWIGYYDTIEAVADGNDDGVVNINDITQIGQNWEQQLLGYNLYESMTEGQAGEGAPLAYLEYAAATGVPTQERLRFSYNEMLTPGAYYCVKPVTLDGEGAASGVYQLTAVPAPEAGQIDLRIGRAGTGTDRELAVRIFAPEAGAEHFAAGAPVVVNVPGGTGGGMVNELPTPGLEGFIQISYSFPGQGLPPYDSEGEFDDRGQRCIDALFDVLCYALGGVDTNGWTLQQLTAANVLTDNVGILARSNGGPLAMAALAQYGGQLTGLAWYVGWENPTCSQTVMPDAGPGGCVIGPSGGVKPDFVNPQYNAWGPLTLDIDLSNIAYDPFPPDSQREVLYLERGGQPHFDTVPVGEAYSSDVNGDGEIGPGEDWGFGYWEHEGKHYYSLPVVEAVWDSVLFTPGSEPPWLPTLAEAQGFWQLRDATYHYATLAGHLPVLKVILVASVRDHVQTAPGHPHICQGFHGFLSNGLWVKLNPSPESLVELAPSLSGRPDLPDMAANVEPADWTDPANHTPEDVLPQLVDVSAAAARELAELVQGG